MRIYRSKVNSVIVVVLLTGFLELEVLAQGMTPKDCSKFTTQQCAIWVTGEIKTRQNPDEILPLGELWNNKFQSSYVNFKSKGLNVRAETDLEKIEGELKDLISPITWAVDISIQALVKRYLQRFATIMKFADSVPIKTLKLYLTPSETSTDFDELIASNNSIQALIQSKLSTKLKPQWDKNYIGVLQKIKPSPSIGPKP